MTEILSRRMTAHLDSPFVVFLIGFRVNKLWKIGKWLPVLRAMRPMVAELSADPESGFLSAEIAWGNPVIMVQYWRSTDDLIRYASDRDAEHLPAWARFNREVGSNGDVGIWHETYRVDPGSYEAVYGNMPRFGLARAGSHIPAEGRWANALGRLDAGLESTTGETT